MKLAYWLKLDERRRLTYVKKAEELHCKKCGLPLLPADRCHRQDHGCDTKSTLWCPCCGDFFPCEPVEMELAAFSERCYEEEQELEYQAEYDQKLEQFRNGA